MIFLDANAFYSYFGRNRLGMNSAPVDEIYLRKYLDNKKKSIPTSVYIEVMTHFRNDSKMLREILKFIISKDVVIYNNIPDYIITPTEIKCTNYMEDMVLSKYAHTLLKKKIEIESNFTLLFFEITKNLYAHYKLMMTDELSEANKSSVLEYIGRIAYKEYQNKLETEIQNELQSGYDENKEKKVLKDFYIRELNDACIFINILIEGCIECKANKEDILSGIQQTYEKSISGGLDGYNGTMPYIVDVLVQDSEFLSMAKLKVSEMFGKGNYSAMQRKYLCDVMFTSWFERGKKIDKNDIFDMFCVGCLDHVDKSMKNYILEDISPYIISFDEKMKQFIGTVKPENLELINKIQRYSY